MNSTLTALVDLLIQAIPTALLFILLTVFLNSVFFKPLAHILEERRKATEGARDLAQQAFEAADKKTSEFEYALQLARNQIYQEGDALRRQWEEEQQAELTRVRAEAERAIEQARSEIAAESTQAQSELDRDVQQLSEQIANALLRRRAA
jgi:F-type H+-transporting ATPase subunit b